MKFVIAAAAAAMLACSSSAFAQSTPSSSRPLADVARQEEARRKEVRKPAKVYTNDDLRPDISAGVPPPPSTTIETPSSNSTPSNTTPAAPGAAAAPAADQAFWQGRIKAAREQQQRLQIFADSLQSRINALNTDFVNRDDPAQRAKIDDDRRTALAELERVKKELDAQAKAITDIEEEARRAGVPAGWLRPGA
jgi:hypothetical protein